MIEKVLAYMKKYHMLEAGDTIAAGISGGADSVCLLFVLLAIRKEIPFSLAVVHVNHGIRREAGEDAAYVKRLCEENKLPFYLTEEDVRARAKELGISEEEAGRQVRYEAFEKALEAERLRKKADDVQQGAEAEEQEEIKQGQERIAVAHNSNDRAETMLFHLFRGTGLTGAAGIKPVNGKVIRPLLGMERAEIEDWLEKQNISYREDSTNAQDCYTRNRIRHHILPYAEEEICRGAVSHLSRAGAQFQEADEFIKRQVLLAERRCTVSYEGAEGAGVQIDLPKFFEEDAYLQSCILMSGFEKAGESRKDITAAHVEGVRELFLKTGSCEMHLPCGLMVYKKYDLGMIVKEDTANKQTDFKDCEVPVPGSLFVPRLGRVEITVFPYKKSENIPQKTYTKWLDYDKITRSILFRVRKAGDYLTINEREDRKSLQDYFVNEKIPKAERDCFYVLADGAHIIWVPGYRISAHYKVSEDTRTILEIKLCEGERSS